MQMVGLPRRGRLWGGGRRRRRKREGCRLLDLWDLCCRRWRRRRRRWRGSAMLLSAVYNHRWAMQNKGQRLLGILRIHGGSGHGVVPQAAFGVPGELGVLLL